MAPEAHLCLAQSKISTLEIAIAENFDRLESSFGHLHPNESFSRFKKKVADDIATGQITDVSMENNWLSYISQSTPDLWSVPLHHSCIYSVLAQDAFEHGESNKGWSFVAHASYLAGLSEINVYSKIASTEAKRRQRVARSGGRGRRDKYRPAKEKVIELLEMHCPPNGWWKEREAAKAIYSDLKDYVDEKRIGLAPSSLTNTVVRWLKEDSTVRPEFKKRARVKTNAL
jgi:hypothetical protein